jgi:hypothetical protein
MINLQPPRVFSANRGVFRDSGFGWPGIFNVITEQCPAAVDLKIEVSAIGPGTEKEFDATVEANHVLESRGPANYVSIINIKMNEQISGIVQQPHLRTRPMVAAPGMKVRDFKLVGAAPQRIVQADFARRRR